MPRAQEQYKQNQNIVEVMFGGNGFLGLNDTVARDKVDPRYATVGESPGSVNFRVSEKGILCKRRGNSVVKKIDEALQWVPQTLPIPANITYTADALPTASTPVWTKTGTSTIESVSAGILRVQETSGTTSYTITDTNLNNVNGTTLVASIKIVEGTSTSDYIHLWIDDGTKKINCFLYKDRAIAEGITYYFPSNYNLSYHTYHLILKGAVGWLYIDGIPRGKTGVSVSTAAGIGFEFRQVANVAEGYIDYVKYMRVASYPVEKIMSMYEYTTNKGFHCLIVQCGAQLLVSKDLENWEVLYDGLNENYRCHYATYLGKCYITNGYDPLLYYDGDQAIGTPLGVENPKQLKMGEEKTKIYEYCATGDTTGEGGKFYGTKWRAQTFTIGNVGTAEAHKIRRVSLKWYRVGSPGKVIISIRKASGGLPVGSDLTSGTMDGNSLIADTAGKWYEIQFTPYSLTPTQYAIVVRAPDGNVTNYIKWRYNASNAYKGGSYCESSDSGTHWSKGDEDAGNFDFMFREYGYVELEFPVGKYIDTCVNTQVMALGHLNEAPNGFIVSSVVDMDGQLINPDNTQAWALGNTVELEEGGGITGVKFFANMLVVTQLHHITVFIGDNPFEYTRRTLKFDDGEESGCISNDVLQVKQGYLYGVGLTKVWRWDGSGNLEDISTGVIENSFNPLKKPIEKYRLWATAEDFNKCGVGYSLLVSMGEVFLATATTGPVDTLAGAITAGATSITLVSATGFTNGGSAYIYNSDNTKDIFTYTGITTNTLIGCVGIDNNHATNTTVKQETEIAFTVLPGDEVINVNTTSDFLSDDESENTMIFDDKIDSFRYAVKTDTQFSGHISLVPYLPPISANDTEVTLASVSTFPTSGSATIEPGTDDADNFTYSGKNVSQNKLTGCVGITYNHLFAGLVESDLKMSGVEYSHLKEAKVGQGDFSSLSLSTRTLTSENIYTGIDSNCEWGIFEADYDLTGDNCGGTIAFYIETATTEAGLDGSDWQSINMGDKINQPLDEPWLHWKAELTQGSATTTPILHSIKIVWLTYKWAQKPVAFVYDNKYMLSMARTFEDDDFNNIVLLHDERNQWLKDTGKRYGSWAMFNDLLLVGDCDNARLYRDEDDETGRDAYIPDTIIATGGVLAGASTINLVNASLFSYSGSATITDPAFAKDDFTYTGKTGNTLTGCLGIANAHASNPTITVRNDTANQDNKSIEFRWISKIEDFGDQRAEKNLRKGRIWIKVSDTANSNDIILYYTLRRRKFGLDNYGQTICDHLDTVWQDDTLGHHTFWFADGREGEFGEFTIYNFSGIKKIEVSSLLIEAKKRTLR